MFRVPPETFSCLGCLPTQACATGNGKALKSQEDNITEEEQVLIFQKLLNNVEEVAKTEEISFDDPQETVFSTGMTLTSNPNILRLLNTPSDPKRCAPRLTSTAFVATVVFTGFFLRNSL